MTMTPRERWLAVLNHRLPDRVPLSYRATPEVTQRLMQYLGVTSFDQVRERLHLDPVVGVGPRYIGPPAKPGYDVFGIGHQSVDYGTGVYNEAVYNPLAQYASVAEIEANYRWPSPDWYDYSGIPAQVQGKDDWIVQGGASEPFATYKDLRGVEQGYLDLVEHPDMVHYCLDRLYDLCHESARRIYETIPGKVVWTWVAEDVGTQEDLIISLAHIEEFFLPRMKRMLDLVHQAGAYAFHHSDGAVRKNLPNMVRLGIDVLEPVQWRCRGMDREGLKRDFGDRLTFQGGVDNQITLAYGSEADVRQEVRDNIRILGAGGGYILGPCHNIQPVTPPQNIVAMYDTAYECGWY
jgi:uroporphyrinogen decarboxylase